jgi:hypothetical protein
MLHFLHRGFHDQLLHPKLRRTLAASLSLAQSMKEQLRHFPQRRTRSSQHLQPEQQNLKCLMPVSTTTVPTKKQALVGVRGKATKGIFELGSARVTN